MYDADDTSGPDRHRDPVVTVYPSYRSNVEGM